MNVLKHLFFLFSKKNNLEFVESMCKAVEDQMDYTDIVHASSNSNTPPLNCVMISFSLNAFSVKKFEKNQSKVHSMFYSQYIKIFYKSLNGYRIKNVVGSVFNCLKKNESDILEARFLEEGSEDIGTQIDTVYLDFCNFSGFIPKEKIPTLEFYISKRILKYIKKDIQVKIINDETLTLCKTSIFKNINDITDCNDSNYFYLPIKNTKFGVRIFYERIASRLYDKNNLLEEDKEVFEYFKNIKELEFILSYFEKYSESKYLILKDIFRNHVYFKIVGDNQILDRKTKLRNEFREYKVFFSIIKYLLTDKIVFSSYLFHRFKKVSIYRPYRMLRRLNCILLSTLRKEKKLYEKLIMKYCRDEIKFENKGLETLFVIDIYRMFIFKILDEKDVKESNPINKTIINIVESHMKCIAETIEKEMLFNYRCVDLETIPRILKN